MLFKIAIVYAKLVGNVERIKDDIPISGYDIYLFVKKIKI